MAKRKEVFVVTYDFYNNPEEIGYRFAHTGTEVYSSWEKADARRDQYKHESLWHIYRNVRVRTHDVQ